MFEEVQETKEDKGVKVIIHGEDDVDASPHPGSSGEQQSSSLPSEENETVVRGGGLRALRAMKVKHK